METTVKFSLSSSLLQQRRYWQEGLTNKEGCCKDGIGIGEAGGEAQHRGREADRGGTRESRVLQQEALTHWEDDHFAAPFLLRLRNQLVLNKLPA